MPKHQIPFLLLIAVTAVARAGITAAVPGNVLWDKAPEQWTLADVFRILQNSPWSPSKFSLEANYTQRHTDAQSKVVSDSPVSAQNTGAVPGVTFTLSHPLPQVTVLWWSCKVLTKCLPESGKDCRFFRPVHTDASVVVPKYGMHTAWKGPS